MESGDKILMAAATGLAVAVGAFVIWGPNSATRLRSRRGQIAGLHNFGKTCFLNSLLQSLASCPGFIAWLQLHNTSDKKSLIFCLQMTLEVVNGTHPTLRGDPFSPANVIRALNSMGWVIPQEEHDPYELFSVILSSIEEESQRPKKIGCLSDALGDANITASGYATMPPPRPSSAMLSDFENEMYSEASNLMRLVRSEAHTPDSPHSTATEIDNDDNSIIDDTLISDDPPSVISTVTMRPSRSRTISTSQQNSDSLNKRISGSCRSLERLTRGPGRVSIWNDKITKQIPNPFRGGLSSQLICSACGYKSVVRLDKFESITLNLPNTKIHGFSLGQLLTEYVAPEILQEVECASCSKNTSHTRQLTFGKLPSCLCIHISRTAWMNGHAFKRQDFVHFPESLSMAPYSFIQPGLSSNCSTPWGSTMSLYSASVSNCTPTNERFHGSPFSSFGGMFPRNLYRLLAVIVHSGDANSGHFIAYRRGSLRNSHKWYYTSDHLVKEVQIEEVLSVPAYMLFYDRGTSRN